MHIYKFRLVTDINEDFFRDVEIKSTQTFENLHLLLVKELKFNEKELASFYLCDHSWHKKQEITFLDMSDEENSIPEMKTSRLCDFIDDPHQHILWVYDFLNMKSFYLELNKISAALQDVEYPRVVGGKGEISSKAVNFDPNALNYIDDNFESQYADYKEIEKIDELTDDIDDEIDDNDDKSIGFENDDIYP